MRVQSNPEMVKKAELLSMREVDSILNLYALKARVAEKRRSEKTKMLGDLLLLKEIIR